ncbi:MAG: pentapeptide repeat-containing protein [Rhodobacteraceae bacterium]|nr:pentapeptide repeat-containing protein [Paracoccaceae bacterium]
MEEVSAPNLEVRIGAIYALERIAQDSLRDHIQIMEILCAYVRENAPSDLNDLNPLQRYLNALVSKEIAEISKQDEKIGAAHDAAKTRPQDLEDVHARNWARGLPNPRSGVQTALQVIGRRSPEQIQIERNTSDGKPEPFTLDLRNSNLRRCDLSRGDFRGADFEGSQLEGTIFYFANVEDADFTEVYLYGTDFSNAVLSGPSFVFDPPETTKEKHGIFDHATLRGVLIQDALFRNSTFEFADLRGARIVQAIFTGGGFPQADFSGAQLSSTIFDNSLFYNTKFRGATFKGTEIRDTQIGSSDFTGSDLTSANFLEARFQGSTMQGTYFFRTRLANAQLKGLKPNGLKGAALRDIDLSKIKLNEAWHEAFGDATVKLPEGFTAGEGPLAHWINAELDDDDFYDEWRAYQERIGYTPPENTA